MASATPQRLPVDEVTAEAVSAAFRLDGFFPEFSADLCSKMFPRSGVQHFRAGEALIEQGETGRDLFLVLAGDVAVQFKIDQMSAEVSRMGAGAVIGEMSLLSGGPRTATVAAATPAFVFRLAFEDVGYILENNPPLAEHLQALARTRSAR
ncbi:MAG: Crp/Fnr family transcriptional regulator [Elusimicrobia bacterium]|nr:Crp/Fnr family transcriptional regulator [Elusimicrobiota bacterium]MDE2510632.1 Crp/Fnr family transcriptional regulator [Elusimicrobiota bacterium]